MPLNVAHLDYAALPRINDQGKLQRRRIGGVDIELMFRPAAVAGNSRVTAFSAACNHDLKGRPPFAAGLKQKPIELPRRHREFRIQFRPPLPVVPDEVSPRRRRSLPASGTGHGQFRSDCQPTGQQYHCNDLFSHDYFSSIQSSRPNRQRLPCRSSKQVQATERSALFPGSASSTLKSNPISPSFGSFASGRRKETE